MNARVTLAVWFLLSPDLSYSWCGENQEPAIIFPSWRNSQFAQELVEALEWLVLIIRKNVFLLLFQ